MGNFWSASDSVGLPTKSLTTLSDGDDCPVCLEKCSAEPQEVCQNGHSMHRECAMTMSFHMKLQCPLCRSSLVCSDCKSGKKSISCNCTSTSSKPEPVSESIQQICTAHLLISIGTFFLPFNPAALLVVILLNCSLMLHRIVIYQQISDEIKKWSGILRIASKITQIGLDIASVVLVLAAAVVAILYSD